MRRHTKTSKILSINNGKLPAMGYSCTLHLLEVLSNSVEMKQAAVLLDDDYLLQVNCSNSAFASCKSFVSKPSVNQL